MKKLTVILCVTILTLFLSQSYSLLYAAKLYSVLDDNTEEKKRNKPMMFEPSLALNVNHLDSENWYSTNDSVMGGKSIGTMGFEQDYGVFSGRISLANNGGFSSVYRGIDTIDVDVDTIDIDVEGDGQGYQLRLGLNINGYRVVYKHEFKTRAGVRETFTFSLDDFVASYHGRIISDAPPIYPERIREVGFLITNKTASDFALSIHKISFYKSQILESAQVLGVSNESN